MTFTNIDHFYLWSFPYLLPSFPFLSFCPFLSFLSFLSFLFFPVFPDCQRPNTTRTNRYFLGTYCEYLKIILIGNYIPGNYLN